MADTVQIGTLNGGCGLGAGRPNTTPVCSLSLKVIRPY